jgi:hypothetical protein
MWPSESTIELTFADMSIGFGWKAKKSIKGKKPKKNKKKS